MPRFTLLLAAGLTLCAGLAAAGGSDRDAAPWDSPGNLAAQVSPRGSSYPSTQGVYGQPRESAVWPPRGSSVKDRRRTGSRATVLQTGRNNKTTIIQRGNNKRAIVVQRGSNTEVIIKQRGKRPGGALVMTW